jgi:hypothetical protein
MRPVRLEWRTATEFKHAGFLVLRDDPDRGTTTVLTPHLIPPAGELAGGAYTFTDWTAPAAALQYWLVDVETTGRLTRHGPVRVHPAPVGKSPGDPDPLGESTAGQ